MHPCHLPEGALVVNVEHLERNIVNCILNGAFFCLTDTGPLCSFASINSVASKVSCNVTYADSGFHPIYAIVTFKLNGVFLSASTIPRTRIADGVFYSESTITNSGGDPGDYTCELTFAPPTDIKHPFVATNAPEFNESCSTTG